MSTLNLQVRLKGPEHLLLFITTLQPGAPQEVFETDAPSAFQVGYCMGGGAPFTLFWFFCGISAVTNSGTPFDLWVQKYELFKELKLGHDLPWKLSWKDYKEILRRAVSLRKFQEMDLRARKVSARKIYPLLDEDKGILEVVSIVCKKPNTDFNWDQKKTKKKIKNSVKHQGRK